MSFVAKPGNIIETEFAGASSAWIPSGAAEAIIARALVFHISKDYPKQLESISYSLARMPFIAAGLYDDAYDNEVFGRLTIFRNFRQDLTNLFDPYFDINYTNALANPNASDYYGARADYAREDKMLDLLITKVDNKTISLDSLKADKNTTLTIVLSPFYNAIKTGDVGPRVFGNYLGDSFARTMSILGTYCY